MNYIIHVILIVIGTIELAAQIDKFNLENTYWINEYGEVLDLRKVGDEGSSSIMDKNQLSLESWHYYLQSDTMQVKSILSYIDDDDKDSTYRFLIISKDEYKLILMPLNEITKTSFHINNNQQIVFYNSIAKIDLSEFDLKELTINQSGYKLQIDEFGNIKLEKSWANDVPRKHNKEEQFGTYVGKLNKSEFNELKESLLRVGFIEGVNFNNLIVCSHCQNTVLKIKFENESRKYKYNYPNIYLRPFIRKIDKFCSIRDLEKMN